MLDCQSRSTANNAGWREDRQWARALDHGWNLGVAKQVLLCSSPRPLPVSVRGLSGCIAWLACAETPVLDRLHDGMRKLPFV